MSCHWVIAFVENNKLVCGLVVTAVVVTMPEPGSPWSWRTLYRWIFDSAHQFMNMRRPTVPAETPAQPKP